MSFTVFLGNLPVWVTADDIKGWLTAENLVADAIKVIRNPETQESKGFAFIEAPNTEEMNSIIRRFDRAPLEDRLLRANPAQPPKPKGATGRPGDRPERGPERAPDHRPERAPIMRQVRRVTARLNRLPLRPFRAKVQRRRRRLPWPISVRRGEASGARLEPNGLPVVRRARSRKSWLRLCKKSLPPSPWAQNAGRETGVLHFSVLNPPGSSDKKFN